MGVKLWGVVLVICASGWMGLGAAAAVQRRTRQLQGMKQALELMRCEITFRLTPIERLCRILSASTKGELARFFFLLSQRLQHGQPVSEAAIEARRQCRGLDLPPQVDDSLRTLFDSFGEFDQAGQLRLLSLAQSQVDQALAAHEKDRKSRVRCYTALGLSAGAALAIMVL